MITIENVGKRILLYGRNQDKISYIKGDDSLSPYFYYEDWKGDYKSIDGKQVSKVTVNHPNEIRELREKYPVTFESDINFTNRYIIDKISKIEKEPIRVCFIDIEIARTKNGYESPEIASNPILCIGCYDSFDEKYIQFYGKEKEFIIEFINYIKDKDPDILVAWNGDMFDFPFLINRINNLGLNANDLARSNGRVYTTEYGAKIFGRILLDLMQAYKKHFSGGGRESWSLDYISLYELKEKGGKEKYKGELDDLYLNDFQKFLDYNKRDIELMILLDKQLKIIDFFDEVRRLCYCKFEDLFMNTKMADCLCLRWAKERNLVLPKCPFTETSEKIIGAYVKNSEKGLHENISVFDMKSLYPSVMIGFNISYETISLTKIDGISIDDKYYFKKEPGIIPSIVKPLLDYRKQVARQMNDVKNNIGIESSEYNSLWMTSYALKVIANSFYGSLLERHFRLYNRDAGQAITYIAQKVIKEVHRWFEEKGLKVIYGDTDSCFIKMEGRTIEDMKVLHKDINDYFKVYFKQFGVEDENNIFKLEFEKVYDTMFFKMKADGIGAKKKYAGRMIWYDGKPIDKISITGFESKRSDNAEAGRKFLADILTMILYKKPREDIDLFIEEFKMKIRKGEFEAERLAMPISITKPLDQYGNQIHAKAARLANEKHKAQIKQGDKIKYIFVTNPERVMAFKTYLPEGYLIDYDNILRRIVDLKVGPIYESLGWEYQYQVFSKKKAIKELTFEEKLKQVGLW